MTTQTTLVTGVDFVSVPTTDFAAAQEFYGTVLGLPCSSVYGRMPGAEFETGNLTLQVFDFTAIGREHRPNKNPIALHVEDVEAARAEFESRGVSFSGDKTGRASWDRLVGCRRPPYRFSLVGLALATAAFGPLGVGKAQSAGGVRTSARELSSPVVHRKTFKLRRPATHIAVYWHGPRSVGLQWALSREGRHFGRARPVPLDDVGLQRWRGETFGAVVPASNIRAVRVWTNRPLSRVSLLVLRDTGLSRAVRPVYLASQIPQPSVIPRAGWGADESLRFDSTGKEIWPPTFWPIQKLIVHHTATANNDPNPAATIRSIYYYHAVTQGWGDIGYNFLIDEAGNMYEGRYSRASPPGESPTGEDLGGNGVTGAHAQGYNSGTVGIALIGTLTNQGATARARDALERLLAWKAERHGLDPLGSSLYTNPVSGAQATFPNISGHRDVAATECPGGSFYATLPAVRSGVAARIGAADLAVTKSDSPDPVLIGDLLTYTVTVRNDGPSVAGGVTLTDALPRSLRVRSLRTSQGRCVLRRSTLTCPLYELAGGGSATLTIAVRPTRSGTVTNTASVAAVQPMDPNTGNNAAAESTRILP